MTRRAGQNASGWRYAWPRPIPAACPAWVAASRLEIKGRRLAFQVPEGDRALLNDTVQRRLVALAEACGLEAVVGEGDR